ncbi:MAG: DNA topoisomerase I [Candidatus Altiarchaeales archaeon IMC4]|nr:MAG: DNA topoisomerase I [Candidatus Altiarchaeales archaeon IMC4]
MVTLIITEKPKVAERIANALGKPKRHMNKKVSYFEVAGDIFVAPAVGHIFGLAEKKGSQRWDYPVFDIEWVPSHVISKNSDYTKAYLDNLKTVAKKCHTFINACDFDVEGSVIGYNAIIHACGADIKKDEIYRMKFSTLTEDAIFSAYKNLHPLDKEMVDAGIARHMMDWYWGINLSRALTTSIKRAGKYMTLSTGRVQGPTLKILSEREKEITGFKSRKYWELRQAALKEGCDIISLHEAGKFWQQDEAEGAKSRCGKSTVVSDITKKRVNQKPPNPFDLTTLQTEAYRCLGIDPRVTLEIAQDLYTSGLMSYPRTSSQQLPAELDLIGIIKKLARNPDYKDECAYLASKSPLKPNNGKKTDPAHPAIHPTGEVAAGLDAQHKKIYDLVVRRFLATFGDDAVRQSVKIEFDNNGQKFIISGSTTVEAGWYLLYGKYAKIEEEELPNVEKGEVLPVRELVISEKETKPPNRYTPASIIREMEKRNIGTKATRAQVLDILFKRGYLDGKSIQVTQLGMNIVETLDKFCPDVLSEKLTRKFEKEMDSIIDGKMASEKVLIDGRHAVEHFSKEFKTNELEIGKSLTGTASGAPVNTLGKCLKCEGNLVLRKSKFGGQFAGCDKYPNCTFTISLPMGMIKKEGTCPDCGYAVLASIERGKRPFLFCVNPRCPKKTGKKEQVSTPSE